MNTGRRCNCVTAGALIPGRRGWPAGSDGEAGTDGDGGAGDDAGAAGDGDWVGLGEAAGDDVLTEPQAATASVRTGSTNIQRRRIVTSGGLSPDPVRSGCYA